MSAYELLTTDDDLDALFQTSNQRPALIFKHSLTCPISTAALRQYETFLEGQGKDKDVRYTLIEIQNHRPLSNAVAERTGVRHESPQALLVKDGEVQWHASHWKITSESLAEAIG
ncbi:MAG: bacillithiol system redox-active protein YtxJ [Acidobacteriota bacterium]